MDIETPLDDLADGPLEVVGRLTSASNVVLQCRTGAGDLCAYKPASGERPLWDYPGAVLALHEVWAFEVDCALDWGLVPPTFWREDAPLGPGMVQAWVHAAPTSDVDVMPADGVPAGWLPVLRAEDERGRDVVVAHRDTARLADVAVFDALINNSDRKAGHLLGDGAAIVGIDHGVAFSPEPRLRTVLWGFAGRDLAPRHISALGRLLERPPQLTTDRDGAAGAALLLRAQSLLAAGTFPEPSPGWPVVPWPLW
ncbi:MAG: SCO1664 family protein [Actinobacteria bacterium]|nr:MAG: SCO1664 family protein [Actinomycetota bacterium]